MAKLDPNDIPRRETYDSDEEYEKALAEWNEALKGPFPGREVPEQDLVTGPYFDKKLNPPKEAHGVE